MAKLKFTPTFDRVLIKPIPVEEEKINGVIRPNLSKGYTLFGEVVKVGPGRPKVDGTMSEMFFKEGQKVMYPQTGGQQLTIDGNFYLIIDQFMILGVCEE